MRDVMAQNRPFGSFPAGVHSVLSFWTYYWIFAKYFGRRVWTDKGKELISSLVLCIATFLVSLLFSQDALTSLEIGVLALVPWLFVFALWQLVKTPHELHVKETEEAAKSEPMAMGLFGILVLVIIASAVIGLTAFIWARHTTSRVVISMPSADPGAKDAEISMLRGQVQLLTQVQRNTKQPQHDRLGRESGGNTDGLPSSPQSGAAPQDPSPSVENMRFVQKGFTEFATKIDATGPCLIKITAPEESRRMASEYGQIVGSVLSAIPGSKCHVEGPSNVEADPDARKLALDGMVAGKVILHAARTQRGLDDLFGQLSFWTPMEKSFDVPKNSPPNFVWLQFGPGMHWKN